MGFCDFMQLKHMTLPVYVQDSLGNFDDCSLTLQPALDPVCTPDGIIYGKEAIVENLLEQRKAIKRKLAAWEAQNEEERQQATERSKVEAEAQLVAFDRQNHLGASASTVQTLHCAFKEAAEHMHDSKVAKNVVAIHENKERMKELKSFWHPSQVPQAKVKKEKPSSDTVCPASGKKLRLKDLIDLKFDKVKPGDPGRYIDPITKQTFTNSSKLVVLRPLGVVLLEETYNKCIKPEGKYEGHKIREKDVVHLRSCGTGFAARGVDKVDANKHYHLGPGNGLADLRGQHQGPRSHGGLQLWN